MYVNLILGSVDLASVDGLARVLDKASGWKELVESGKVSKENAFAVVKLSLENRFSYEWRDFFDFVKGGVVKWEVHRVGEQGEFPVPWLLRRSLIATVEYEVSKDIIAPADEIPEELEDFMRSGLQHDAAGRDAYLSKLFDADTGERTAKEMTREDAKKDRLYFRALRQISVRG